MANMAGQTMKNPAADAAADGAIGEDSAETVSTMQAVRTATVSRLRWAHLAQLCGLTDQQAAMLAALVFAGGAS